MPTLKEFEEALREQGMHMALAILQRLRERDRERRSIAPARRVTGRKMTPEVAREILELHATTGMTQQEIAFQLGVNQGRVNEVVKHGKWLTDDPASPEAVSRDRALARARAWSRLQAAPGPAKSRPALGEASRKAGHAAERSQNRSQLSFRRFLRLPHAGPLARQLPSSSPAIAWMLLRLYSGSPALIEVPVLNELVAHQHLRRHQVAQHRHALVLLLLLEHVASRPRAP